MPTAHPRAICSTASLVAEGLSVLMQCPTSPSSLGAIGLIHRQRLSSRGNDRRTLVQHAQANRIQSFVHIRSST